MKTRGSLRRYFCFSCLQQWGDELPPCEHPSFSQERLEYMGYKTGDWLCNTCGDSFSEEAMDEIKRQRGEP